MRRDQTRAPEPMRSTLPNTDQPRIPHSEYHYTILLPNPWKTCVSFSEFSEFSEIFLPVSQSDYWILTKNSSVIGAGPTRMPRERVQGGGILVSIFMSVGPTLLLWRFLCASRGRLRMARRCENKPRGEDPRRWTYVRVLL